MMKSETAAAAADLLAGMSDTELADLRAMIAHEELRRAEERAQKLDETFILPVTVGGETREVEFKADKYGRARSGYVFAARIGFGAKLHMTDMMAVKRNGEWRAHQGVTVLNRQATIVAWRDKVGAGAKSQHHSTRIA